MRKNATKIAAIVLSLALTVTSVNVPTTSSAAAKVKLNKKKVTLTVGKTTNLVAKVNGKKVKATFTSSNKKVAKVAKKTGKVTAVKAGTAKITAKYNGKKAVCKVTVKKKATPATQAPTEVPTQAPTEVPTQAPTEVPTQAPTEAPTEAPTQAPVVKEAKNITVKLTNPLNDSHVDTVLVGTNAEIRVQVTDEDGKAVANESVIISLEKVTGDNALNYENKTDDVLKTDANGYVTYVIGADKKSDAYGAIDSTRTDYVSNLKLTASVVGKDSVKTTSNLKFAAIYFDTSKVKILNGTDVTKYPALVSGTNKTAGSATSVTHTADGSVSSYVNSQQVSADGVNHAVTLSSDAYLWMPGTEVQNTASEIAKEINHSSGKQSIYTEQNWNGIIDTAKASDLQYATINFDSVKISKYSKLYIQAYLTTNLSNPWAAATWIGGTTIDGEKDLKNFSYQIPVSATSGYLFVNVGVVTPGQVNTDMNDGFVLKNVVGVLKSNSSTSNDVSEKLSGVTVEWSKVDASYTMPTALTDSVAAGVYAALNASYPTANGYTFEYKVPAFPQTGNAIITVYDADKKATAYWAVPTQNAENWTANGQNGYKNENVIVDDTTNLYQISKAEAENMVGTVTTDANGNAVVDSKATGVTHVQGVITSTNENIKIDVTNNKIYSSVQWNPIPNAAVTTPGAVPTRMGGAAFAGQKITLNAQLKDRNGNDATTAGVGVDFKVGDTVLAADTPLDGVEIVEIQSQTDATGKAKLVVIAANPAQLIGLSATTSSNYTLAYALGSETVTANVIDLYWLDAELAFLDIAWGTAQTTSTSDPYKTITGTIQPAAATNWEYGVYSVPSIGNVVLDGKLAGYGFDSITGLTIQTTTGADSVGTVTNMANGKANVTSTVAGSTYLVNTLNNASIGNDVTFTFKKNNAADVVLKSIGEGTPNLDKQLTLDVNWQTTTATAQVIVPTGTKALAGATVNVYVKVVDTLGNPIKDKTVTIANPVKGTVTPVNAVTDAKGIATFTVTHDTAAESTTLVATVDGIKGMTATASIKWVAAPATPLAIETAEYSYNTKTVTIKFNKDIQNTSVVKDLFTVTCDGAKQIIGDVKVSGKTVTLTLPALANLTLDSAMTVAVATAITADNIVYDLAATDGEVVTAIADTAVTIK